MKISLICLCFWRIFLLDIEFLVDLFLSILHIWYSLAFCFLSCLLQIQLLILLNTLCMMTNSFLATSKIYSLQIGLRRVSTKWGQMITTLSLWSFSWKLQHMSDSKNTLWMRHLEEIPNISALSRRWRAVIFYKNHGCKSTGFARYHAAVREGWEFVKL